MIIYFYRFGYCHGLLEKKTMLTALVESSKVNVKNKIYHILGVKVANSLHNEDQYGIVLLSEMKTQLCKWLTGCDNYT